MLHKVLLSLILHKKISGISVYTFGKGLQSFSFYGLHVSRHGFVGFISL